MAKKDPAAVALGSRRTRKKAAASRKNAQLGRDVLARMDPELRREIARKGALARWAKHK